MNPEFKAEVNRLAALFYKAQGYKSYEGFDFSESQHPSEKALWNQALIAFAFIKNDFDLLDYQV